MYANIRAAERQRLGLYESPPCDFARDQAHLQCIESGCAITFLSDGYCDTECNSASCNFDAFSTEFDADCRVNPQPPPRPPTVPRFGADAPPTPPLSPSPSPFPPRPPKSLNNNVRRMQDSFESHHSILHDTTEPHVIFTVESPLHNGSYLEYMRRYESLSFLHTPDNAETLIRRMVPEMLVQLADGDGWISTDEACGHTQLVEQRITHVDVVSRFIQSRICGSAVLPSTIFILKLVMQAAPIAVLDHEPVAFLPPSAPFPPSLPAPPFPPPLPLRPGGRSQVLVGFGTGTPRRWVWRPSPAAPPKRLEFDGARSYDMDGGEVKQWSWSVSAADAQVELPAARRLEEVGSQGMEIVSVTATTATVNVSMNTVLGSHTIHLNVTDDRGASGSATIIVVVAECPDTQWSLDGEVCIPIPSPFPPPSPRPPSRPPPCPPPHPPPPDAPPCLPPSVPPALPPPDPPPNYPLPNPPSPPPHWPRNLPQSPPPPPSGPSPPLAPPPPPPPFVPVLCSNECWSSYDVACDDGGLGSANSECVIGTDCGDCGPRFTYPP